MSREKTRRTIAKTVGNKEMSEKGAAAVEKQCERSVRVKHSRKTIEPRDPAKPDEAFAWKTKKSANDISRKRNDAAAVASGRPEESNTKEKRQSGKSRKTTADESGKGLEDASKSRKASAAKAGKSVGDCTVKRHAAHMVKSEKLKDEDRTEHPRKRSEERDSAELTEMRVGTSTPRKTLSGSNVAGAKTVPANVIVKTETKELSNSDCDDHFERATQKESFSTKCLNNNEYEDPTKFRQNERKSTTINYAGESIDAPGNIKKRAGKGGGDLPKTTKSAGKRSPNAKLPANSGRNGTTHERKIGEVEKRLLEREERKRSRRVRRRERILARAFEEFTYRVASAAKTMGYLPVCPDNSSSDSSDESSSCSGSSCSCSDSSCSCSYSCSCSCSCSSACSCTSCSSYGTDEYSEYTLCSSSECDGTSSTDESETESESD